MDGDDLRKLEDVGSALSFGAGQMLIERGLPGTGLYVVVEGHVVVGAPEGNRELGPGSVIGERALLSPDGTRTARVRATTHGVVLAVERTEVDRLCAEDPAFAFDNSKYVRDSRQHLRGRPRRTQHKGKGRK